MARYITALTIAGSDSSGGAGIQADIKTMSALGVYATTAITAVTAQGKNGIEKIETVAPETVRAQIIAAIEYSHPRAIKIGMLGTAEITETVSDTLERYPEIPIVIDPVLASTSGTPLLDTQAIDILKMRLLPLATLITPNKPEAALLALDYRKHKAVLVKGGHSTDPTKSEDTLYLSDGTTHIYSGERIATPNTHGTGCTLSSAITAYLARGEELPDACAKAKAYIDKAIREGAEVVLENGIHGPLNHLFSPLPLIKENIL